MSYLPSPMPITWLKSSMKYSSAYGINRRIRKNGTPWMTKAALERSQRRDYAYRKFLSNRSDETCRVYKTLQNAVTNAV